MEPATSLSSHHSRAPTPLWQESPHWRPRAHTARLGGAVLPSGRPGSPTDSPVGPALRNLRLQTQHTCARGPQHTCARGPSTRQHRTRPQPLLGEQGLAESAHEDRRHPCLGLPFTAGLALLGLPSPVPLPEPCGVPGGLPLSWAPALCRRAGEKASLAPPGSGPALWPVGKASRQAAPTLRPTWQAGSPLGCREKPAQLPRVARCYGP